MLNPSKKSNLDKLWWRGIQKSMHGVSIISFSDITLTFHPFFSHKITIFNIIPKTRWHEKQVPRVDLNQHYRIQQKHSYIFAFISTLHLGLLNKKIWKSILMFVQQTSGFYVYDTFYLIMMMGIDISGTGWIFSVFSIHFCPHSVCLFATASSMQGIDQSCSFMA